MGIPGGPEGESIPQVSGVMSGDQMNQVASHKLIDGHDYSCEYCSKTYTAPFVSRCICGIRICDNCYGAHESGG